MVRAATVEARTRWARLLFCFFISFFTILLNTSFSHYAFLFSLTLLRDYGTGTLARDSNRGQPRQGLWFKFKDKGRWKGLSSFKDTDRSRAELNKSLFELKVARVGWADGDWMVRPLRSRRVIEILASSRGFWCSTKLDHLEDRGSRRDTTLSGRVK